MVMNRFQNCIQIPESKLSITNPIDVEDIVPNAPKTSQILITGKMHF